jgi:hypothetical protein
MIIITTFNNATEAYAAKNLLESHHIHCQLRGDLSTQQIEPIGNIELLVNAHDVELAEEVLANALDEE